MHSGRFPHTIIFTGEKGTGKHTMSLYAAMLRLCDNPMADESGLPEPCGVCRQCRRIQDRIHPDVIYPEKSGKLQIYTRETMRGVVSDAYIKPADTDIKLYIFEDFENTDTQSQNVLLKIIEDPPSGVGFIFTAVSQNGFLETILSRAVTLRLPETTKTEAVYALRESLADKGKYTYEQIEKAVAIFGGNIGKSVEYLDGGPIAQSLKHVSNFTNALISNDEYEMLKIISEIGDNREALKGVFIMFSEILRDAAVITSGSKTLISCYPEGADALSRRYTKKRNEKIYRLTEDFITRCETNMNAPITAAALVAEIMG
jgi:DNA polymerase-3 subunit delta'